jgi:hypothetical protein
MVLRNFALACLAALASACSAQVEASGQARTAASLGEDGDAPEARTPRQPVTCHGNDRLELRGAYIRTPGNAVEAHGNCTIVLTDSDVQAGGVALKAHGNARIEVKDSRVDGTESAVEASGNSSIVAVNSVLSGPIQKSGNASVDVTR